MAMPLVLAERGKPNKETAIPTERWHWCGITDCTNTVHPDFVFCIACRQNLGPMTVGYCNMLWQYYIDEPSIRKTDLFLFEEQVAKANIQIRDCRRTRAARKAQQRQMQVTA